MKNRFDYLRCYNNLDVSPLIEAIQKHRKFHHDNWLGMHKDAISLSDQAEKTMFSISRQNRDKNNATFIHVYSDSFNKKDKIHVKMILKKFTPSKKFFIGIAKYEFREKGFFLFESGN